MTYKTTTICVSVHSEEENPIFGETATQVMIDDDAAGPYIVLKQCNDSVKEGEVRIDFKEFDVIAGVVKTLMVQFDSKQTD
jgi:hypothetical protein